MKVEFKNINTGEIKTFTNVKELDIFIQSVLSRITGKITKECLKYGDEAIDEELSKFFSNKLKYWNNYIDEWELRYQEFEAEEVILNEDTPKKREKNGKPKQNANGDGSFYYSEALSKWVGQYGRKTVTQRKNETKTQCKERWEKLKSEIKGGTYIETSADTLYSILERHIEQKHKDGITKDRAYKRNKETLEQIRKTCKNFIDKPIQKVTIEMIEDAKENIRKYAPNTIDKIWGMMKCGFRIATSRRKTKFNIMDDPDLTKPISIKTTKQIDALTLKEEEKLRNILNNEEKEHKYRNVVVLQLNTGMRIGEVLARSNSDYNNEAGTLHIWNTLTEDDNYKVIMGEHTKVYDKINNIDRGERTIPLDAESIKIIDDLQKRKIINIYDLLFWDYSKNTFVTPNEITAWLRRLNSKYHILEKEVDKNGNKRELTTHVLRHTKITRMQEAGIALAVIQCFVGHVEGSKMTNDVYTTVSLEFMLNELKKMVG